jgi:hypothetical protein
MFTAATVQANAVPPISEMNSKQLGLLHQLLDRDARFAVLINPGNPQIRSCSRTCRWRLRPRDSSSKSSPPQPHTISARRSARPPDG